LENNYTDIICLLRNPWGKNSRGLQWTGDWGPECDLWNKHTKRQVGSKASAPTESQFWISLGDVLKMFLTMSINHSDPTFRKRVIPADIEGIDAPNQSDSSNKQWGVIHIKTKLHYPHGFFRLH
jgi:hypothetical protein